MWISPFSVSFKPLPFHVRTTTTISYFISHIFSLLLHYLTLSTRSQCDQITAQLAVGWFGDTFSLQCVLPSLAFWGSLLHNFYGIIKWVVQWNSEQNFEFCLKVFFLLSSLSFPALLHNHPVCPNEVPPYHHHLSRHFLFYLWFWNLAE